MHDLLYETRFRQDGAQIWTCLGFLLEKSQGRGDWWLQLLRCSSGWNISSSIASFQCGLLHLGVFTCLLGPSSRQSTVEKSPSPDSLLIFWAPLWPFSQISVHTRSPCFSLLFHSEDRISISILFLLFMAWTLELSCAGPSVGFWWTWWRFFNSVMVTPLQPSSSPHAPCGILIFRALLHSVNLPLPWLHFKPPFVPFGSWVGMWSPRMVWLERTLKII